MRDREYREGESRARIYSASKSEERGFDERIYSGPKIRTNNISGTEDLVAQYQFQLKNKNSRAQYYAGPQNHEINRKLAQKSHFQDIISKIAENAFYNRKLILKTQDLGFKLSQLDLTSPKMKLRGLKSCAAASFAQQKHSRYA